MESLATETNSVGVNKTKIHKKEKIMEQEQEINVEDVKSVTASETAKRIAKENDEILELGSRHLQQDLARQAIKEGTDLETFRGQLLDSIPSGKPLETSDIGLTEKESRDFSILKAVYAMSNPTNRRLKKKPNLNLKHHKLQKTN